MIKKWWLRFTEHDGSIPTESRGLIEYAGQPVPVEVIRTRRKKTIALKIVEGQVRVLAPKRFPQKRIDELVRSKAQWINKKLQLQTEAAIARKKAYVSGDSFPYLGKYYRLRLLENSEAELKLKRGQFVLGVASGLNTEQRREYVRAALLHWYQQRAELRLKQSVSQYAAIIGVEPSSVVVKTYKSRWGSCSIHGDITFNWKIILAPQSVVDYVVVHELCHMLQHNHSPRFWQCVEQVMPGYRLSREWLKENGRLLDI